MTSAYFWSFLTPPPLLPLVSICQTLNNPPKYNDVCCKQISQNFYLKKLRPAGTRLGAIKNHHKFKSWVFLFMYLLQLQQNILFIIGQTPLPHVRFCQYFTDPPPPDVICESPLTVIAKRGKMTLKNQ